ncbi:PilZ domain-containing protein [Pseudobacteriovorax antillogorgiicola]|uniref:PilZ domain-containing protein n=1 Tax=Pseudobacteriovorax antillogorgiicola TaxID=1513793 RepID=A0A1Y6C4Y5_9BACT|nr:PilZ domain-containing protein [Pseudobacteriovorax antillogorgiicola]TCS51258.1 PilZ domain-containing protein [Pseudobacteriovorax antillogorgiicola]SMF36446.1 PilZ domain-containing protein [Pseudobacteriovorax antillogorgiicola]
MKFNYSGRGTLACVKVIELGQISHRYPIEAVFDRLAQIQAILRDSCNRHGGLYSGDISTTFYTFFGWDASTTQDPLEHTHAAFKWAQYVQNYLAQEIAGHDTEAPLILLRIGLNTGYYHIHRDVEQSFQSLVTDDFPLIDQSTDLCGINGIILNEKLLRALAQHGVKLQHLHKLKEKFPHHANLLTFYEYNAVSPDTNLNKKVITCVKDSLNRRETKRWPCEHSQFEIKDLQTDDSFSISNLSVDGLEVVGNQPKTTGSFFKFCFVSNEESIIQELVANDLNLVEAQVRWQRHDGQFYRIGLRIENVTLSDREEIVRILLFPGKKGSLLSLTAS